MLKMRDKKECIVTAKEQLAGVVTAQDRWMFAMWGVAPSGKLEMRRTTCDFPLDRVPDALRQLADDLEKEASGLDTSPLPVAPGFNSISDAIGEGVAAHATNP